MWLMILTDTHLPNNKAAIKAQTTICVYENVVLRTFIYLSQSYVVLHTLTYVVLHTLLYIVKPHLN